jgi:hypothetical protein
MRSLPFLAALLLAGCLSSPAPATTTTDPPAAPAGPLPRHEAASVTVDYTLREQNCGTVGGTTDVNGGPNTASLQPQAGDKALTATITWRSTTPLDAQMQVALVGADGSAYASTSGSSPLVLKVSEQDLLDAGAPEPLGLSVQPGGPCGAQPSIGSAQSVAVAIDLSWNGA